MKRSKTPKINFDDKHYYIIEMVPIDKPELTQYAEPVECVIENDYQHNAVIVKKDGYHNLFFFDIYFDALLKSNHIIKTDKEISSVV